MSAKRIRVLIVDDSAFARKVIREVLSRSPEIEVLGIARDGVEALEKIAEYRPDVITLDLMMPDLDGLGVLRALSGDATAPRVVVVSVAGSDSDLAIEALQNGAVELVTKPTPLPTDRLYGLSTDLLLKVKAAAIAKPRKSPISPHDGARLLSNLPARETSLLVIGTSTGGPQALTELFKSLPGDLPFPIAIALHIPAGYTAPLAERISRASQVPVQEASDGMTLKPGQAFIAPGGKHLRVRAMNGVFHAHISKEPPDSLYFPSVDILFESAAQAAGEGALGLVLTGMGDDGLRGARAIHDAGGRVLAESATSCVVYGMPRCVIEADLADAEAPLSKLAELVADAVTAPAGSSRSAEGVLSHLQPR